MKRGFITNRNKKVSQNEPVLIMDDDLTLQQALTKFIRAKEVEGVRSRTINEYISHIKYLSDYMTEKHDMQKVYLRDLSVDIIRDYTWYLLKEKKRYVHSTGRKDKTVGLSANTVNIRLRTLRTMCRFWHAEGLKKDNPMHNIKQITTDEIDEVPGLTDVEVDLVITSFDNSYFPQWRDRILCLLLLDTGLRVKEATSLTIDRINFYSCTIYVPSQIAKNRRNREVPISPEVAKELKQLYNETKQYFEETKYIFNTAYGEPLVTDAFRKRLNRLKKKLGMERLSPHMFRHTFCRKYILNGGDIFTLQKIVDHADINTTRKYIQLDTDHIRAQHSKFSPVRRLYKRY